MHTPNLCNDKQTKLGCSVFSLSNYNMTVESPALFENHGFEGIYMRLWHSASCMHDKGWASSSNSAPSLLLKTDTSGPQDRLNASF